MTDLVERLRDFIVDDPNYGKCLRMSLDAEDVEEAATAIEAKDKELAALRERVESSDRAADTYCDWWREQRTRAETAERERNRIADELDTINNNHRVMAKLLADTGRERDEAREALEPFARAIVTASGEIVGLMREHLSAARAITGEKT